MKKKTKEKKVEDKQIVGTICNDKNCPFHGSLKVRGRVFEGKITKKFPKRIVIEFERMIYIRKYERYARSRTKIHARLPDCMKDQVKVGDLIKIQECRPLSKIIHFVVIKKIKDAEELK
ncbi:MAG: 30S ribosomal protein S17 [Nanoarchaeota archaeon]|nr:30S ribosomal protein S17 [Nanoarchaeota archaeon]